MSFPGNLVDRFWFFIGAFQSHSGMGYVSPFVIMHKPPPTRRLPVSCAPFSRAPELRGPFFPPFAGGNYLRAVPRIQVRAFFGRGSPTWLQAP